MDLEGSLLCTRTHHWPQFWVRWIHITPSHYAHLRSSYILSSHLCLGLPGSLCPSGLWPAFCTKLWSVPCMTHSLPFHCLWFQYPNNVWLRVQVIEVLVVKCSQFFYTILSSKWYSSFRYSDYSFIILTSNMPAYVVPFSSSLLVSCCLPYVWMLFLAFYLQLYLLGWGVKVYMLLLPLLKGSNTVSYLISYQLPLVWFPPYCKTSFQLVYFLAGSIMLFIPDLLLIKALHISWPRILVFTCDISYSMPRLVVQQHVNQCSINRVTWRDNIILWLQLI